MFRFLLLSALFLVGACNEPSSPAAEEPEGEAPTKAAAASPPADQPPPPPALDPKPGTVIVENKYVQDCREPACPELLQDAAVTHCETLELHGLSWRLVTLDEIQSLAGNDALAQMESFQWTSSAWEEDASQFWIFDPKTRSKTTAKPDRKAFTARCVAVPGV